MNYKTDSGYEVVYPQTLQNNIIDFNACSIKMIITTSVETEYVTATSETGRIFLGERTEQSNVWIINANEYGQYVLKCSNGEQYNQEVFIDECKIYNIDFLNAPTILERESWDFISQASSNNTASSYWRVGDTKTITLNGTIGTVQLNNLQLQVFILGFNHNSQFEGRNRTHFGCFLSEKNSKIIALTDSYYSQTTDQELAYTMNTSMISSGGWRDSKMRKTILNSNAITVGQALQNSFLNALPDDLKNVLKKTTKYSDNVGDGANHIGSETQTEDFLWLLDYYECNASSTQYVKQYNFFKVNPITNNVFQYDDENNAVICTSRRPSNQYKGYFLNNATAGTVVKANVSGGLFVCFGV